jgi:hypothetical protein
MFRPARLTVRATRSTSRSPTRSTVSLTTVALRRAQQFREGKWLDEIIIAAGTEAAHPIVDLAKSADDQGGRDDPTFPEAPDDRKPIDIRKHAVDYHHSIIGRISTAQSVAAVARQINLIAARREEIHKLLGCFRIILNDENPASPSYHNLASPNQCARAVDCILLS